MFDYHLDDIYDTAAGKYVVVKTVGDGRGNATVETRLGQRYDVDEFGLPLDKLIDPAVWAILRPNANCPRNGAYALMGMAPKTYVIPAENTKFATRSAKLGFIDWARMGSTIAVELTTDDVRNAFGGTIPAARDLGILLLNEVNDFSPLSFTNPTLLNPGGPKLLFQADVRMWQGFKNQPPAGVNSGAALRYMPPQMTPLNVRSGVMYYDGSAGDSVDVAATKQTFQCTCEFYALLREGCKCGAAAAERKAKRA